MTDTKIVKSSQLEPGNVVREHGMRVRINSVRPYDSHTGMTAYSCPGTVLNPEEVRAAGIVPMSFLRCDVTGHPDGACWHVQGNDLATWVIEIDSA